MKVNCKCVVQILYGKKKNKKQKTKTKKKKQKQKLIDMLFYYDKLSNLIILCLKKFNLLNSNNKHILKHTSMYCMIR